MTYDSDHDLGIKLDSPQSCEAELQRVSNGLAELTQEFTALNETLATVEDQYEQVEAILARSIRDGSDAKLTATEVRGRLTELISDDENFAHVRESVLALRADKETLERRLRTLEKRMSAAQSALNAHIAEAKTIGHGARS